MPADIAIMLGAEIGTCADTLVATIGQGRPALRTSVLHLLFNLVCVSVEILLAPQLAQLTQAISGEDVRRQIANAQIMFNIIGVVAVIGFLPLIARTLEQRIPEMEADRQRQARQAEKHQANEKRSLLSVNFKLDSTD